MKKNYFNLFVLSAFVLVSCSEDSTYEGVQEVGEQAIQFCTSSVSASTKGVGFIDSDVVWGDKTVRVYAVDKQNFPTALTDRASAPLFSGVDVRPADAVDNVNTVTDAANGTYYYPRKGAFNFFAYYSDDAVADKEGVYDEATTSYYVDFTIDGTQDLMMAKGEPNKTPDVNYDGDLLFSSQSARDGYMPKLTLQHQLARLSFYVVWGTEANEGDNASNEVYVKSLTVKNVDSEGKMHFMAADDANRTIVWSNQNIDMPVKELDASGNAQALNFDVDYSFDFTQYPSKQDFLDAGLSEDEKMGKYHITLDKKDDMVLIGTPIMVQPREGATGYELELVLIQYYDKDGNLIPEDQRQTTYASIPVKLTTGNFEAGTNYTVKLKANSLASIQVEIEVTPWVDSDEEIIIDPDTTL